MPSKLYLSDIAFGWITGLVVTFAISTLTSPLSVFTALGIYPNCGCPTSIALLMTYVINHSSPHNTCWTLFISIVVAVVSGLVFLSRPIFRFRYFIAALLGAVLACLCFIVSLDQIDITSYTPMDWGILTNLNDQWLMLCVAQVLVDHFDVIILVPIGFVAFISLWDWKVGKFNSSLGADDWYKLQSQKVRRCAVAVSVILLVGAVGFVFSRGARAENRSASPYPSVSLRPELPKDR